MTPRLAARAQATLAGGLVWPVLCGCMLFGPSAPAVPEPEYEGCSNDHIAFFSSEEGAQVVVDSGVANKECNTLRFYSGGGGQGGDVFHIEPRIRVTGTLESVTWEVYDLDGSGILFAQGFEVYEEDLVEVDGGFEFRAQVFIGPDERGKNLRLRAVTYTYVNGEQTIGLVAEAAVYLSEPG